jgi:TRAP transporter TAXI family solute receptor
VLVLLVLLPLLAGTGCVGPRPEHGRLRIATGSQTAVYHALGTSLGEIIDQELPGADPEVLVTAASVENVALVSAGAAEIGFTQADILNTRGEQPDPRISALARVYEDLLHLVARADGPVRTLADLRGGRVSVGAAGSGTEVTVDRLLAVADLDGPGRIDRRRWGLDRSAQALRSGELDAFFFSGGLPVRAIEELNAETGARIIDLAEWIEPMRTAHGDVYVVRDVPASVYRLSPVSTIAVPNLLIVPTAMPEQTAFALTRLLFERRQTLAGAHPAAERLESRSAIATMPVPLHPGAADYYRSIKP